MKSFAQWCGAKTFTSMREVEMAQEAWDYQQDRIESLEDELHCVRAYNDELMAEIEKLKQSSNKQIDNATEVINSMRHKNPRYKRWLALNGFKGEE